MSEDEIFLSWNSSVDLVWNYILEMIILIESPIKSSGFDLSFILI